jgi:hypothetical protein
MRENGSTSRHGWVQNPHKCRLQKILLRSKKTYRERWRVKEKDKIEEDLDSSMT